MPAPMATWGIMLQPPKACTGMGKAQGPLRSAVALCQGAKAEHCLR